MKVTVSMRAAASVVGLVVDRLVGTIVLGVLDEARRRLGLPHALARHARDSVAPRVPYPRQPARTS